MNVEGAKSIFLEERWRASILRFGPFLVHSDDFIRSFFWGKSAFRAAAPLGVQPGVPGHAKPPRTSRTCREGRALNTPRGYRGISTFLNSLDDMMSSVRYFKVTGLFTEIFFQDCLSKSMDVSIHISFVRACQKCLKHLKYATSSKS